MEELVTCEICDFRYDDDRRIPKFLDCFHSYCTDCLGKIYQTSSKFECPVCRSVTPGSSPDALTTNFYITRLMSAISDGTGSTQTSSRPASGAVASSARPDPTHWNGYRIVQHGRSAPLPRPRSKWVFDVIVLADEGVEQKFAVSSPKERVVRPRTPRYSPENVSNVGLNLAADSRRSADPRIVLPRPARPSVPSDYPRTPKVLLPDSSYSYQFKLNLPFFSPSFIPDYFASRRPGGQRPLPQEILHCRSPKSP
jgi:hypothetical protein